KAEPEPEAAGGGDAAAELKELKAKLAQKEKESKELSAALDAALAGGSGGGESGFMSETATAELESTIVELSQQNGALTAQTLEKDEQISNLQKDLEAQKAGFHAQLKEEAKKRGALEREVQRKLEEKQNQQDAQKAINADLDELKKANEKLVLDNDELKDKVEMLSYRAEQEASRRGEIVREKIKEVQMECKRLEESNAELRTLVEAYEEKIDELDEKVEELEGEHEELERLLDEAKAEVGKVKSAREAAEKTMRQRIQKLEETNEELQSEVQRLRAAGVGVKTGDDGQLDPELKAKIVLYEKYLEAAEVLDDHK